MTYADAAEAVLRETGNDGVMWGDSGLLDEIYFRRWPESAGLHPLGRWKRVLDALGRACDRRDRRFEPRRMLLGGRWFRVFRLASPRPTAVEGGNPDCSA